MIVQKRKILFLEIYTEAFTGETMYLGSAVKSCSVKKKKMDGSTGERLAMN